MTISPVTNSTATAAASQAKSSQPLFNKQEFSQLMMLMMMGSLGSSSSSSSSDSSSLSGGLSGGGGGMNMSMLMLPLMMRLLEKLDGAASSEKVASDQMRVTEPAGEPVHGVLTQGFHAAHHGLDFGIPTGTDIKTTMDGKVIYAGWNNEGYGNLVIVENGPYRTYYAHLSEIPVKVGDAVSRGDVVGLSGSTGNSTGPHLHYEVRVNGQTIDPTSITLGQNA